VPANASLTPFDIIDLVMTDIVELDGAPWECCPRSTLKQAPLADFEGETGLTIVSAFEQEFQIVGASWRPALAFSLQAQRRCDPFAAELMAALDEAGSNPKFFCLSTAATSSRSAAIRSLGGAAADRVVAVREITREIALLDGRDTSAMLDRYVGIY
jgi:glutamine synthetase